jgi:ribosomal protein S18 acetylase RimI-like enzyme
MNTIIKKADEIDCSKITLEVRENNHRAQKLYKNLGFENCQPKMFFWVKEL